MSMFLGPIHYWLYNKINNQEKLTAAIAAEASKNSWISNASEYTKELPALESVIDESNIHGWLQSQITDAEMRYASLIALLGDKFDEIKALAFDFGKSNAVDAKADAEGIYKYFEDFFVNGMPCDHVNSVVAQGEDSLTWKMSQDIHAQNPHPMQLEFIRQDIILKLRSLLYMFISALMSGIPMRKKT